MGTNGSRFNGSDNAEPYVARQIKSKRSRGRRALTDRDWLIFAAFWIGVLLVLWGGGLLR